MKITENQLYDYMFCPAKYDLKYNKKIDIKEPKSMNHLLNKVSRYFYINLMNEKILNFSEIQKKWDSICEANEDYIDHKKSIDGLFLLKKMYEWARAEKLFIADIDTQYRIVIKDTELIGNMKPVRITMDKQIEILDTDFGNNKNQIDVDMKLKYSIDSYAFQLLNKEEIDGIRIHNIKNNYDLFTKKSIPDYKRMESTIEGISNGIKNDVYYPREQVLCKTCTARDYCKYWHK